MTEKLK